MFNVAPPFGFKIRNAAVHLFESEKIIIKYKWILAHMFWFGWNRPKLLVCSWIIIMTQRNSKTIQPENAFGPKVMKTQTELKAFFIFLIFYLLSILLSQLKELFVLAFMLITLIMFHFLTSTTPHMERYF